METWLAALKSDVPTDVLRRQQPGTSTSISNRRQTLKGRGSEGLSCCWRHDENGGHRPYRSPETCAGRTVLQIIRTGESGSAFPPARGAGDDVKTDLGPMQMRWPDQAKWPTTTLTPNAIGAALPIATDQLLGSCWPAVTAGSNSKGEGIKAKAGIASCSDAAGRRPDQQPAARKRTEAVANVH